jgi:hypothetical protein
MQAETIRSKFSSWVDSVGGYKALYQVLLVASCFLIILIVAYGVISSIVTDSTIIGQTLVDVEFPPPSVFPVYAKPISYLMGAILVLVYSGLELARPRLGRLSPESRSVLRLLLLIAATFAAYQLLYNFAIWAAQIATNTLLGVLNPDVIINPFPSTANPWNLVFATKMSATAFAACIYALYFLVVFEREKERTSSKPLLEW